MNGRFEGSDTGFLPTPRANDVKGHNQRRNQDCLEGATAFGMTVSARVDWGRFAPAIRRWERTMGRSAPCPTQASSALCRWLDSHPTMLCARWLVRHAPRRFGPVMPDQPERDRMLECWRRVSDGTDLLDPIWLTGHSIPATLMPPECVLDLWRERGASRFSFTHLSPRFDEWMMGLPDGWLTDPNIWTGVQGNPRNMQLRLCGNGVVPQQAAAAIRWALGVRGRICGGKGDEL